MIACVHYTCIGSEVNDGINTELYFPPASGHIIIDVIVKGTSRRILVNNNLGFIVVNDLLVRGDLVQIIYKTLPRFVGAVTDTPDFDYGDFDSGFFG